jgi:hypothetical protein
MALVAWALQNPLYNGYFASIPEIKSVIRAAATIAQSGDPDSVIKNCMDACKADLAERVSIRAQDVFPDSIAMYKGVWERAQTRMSNIMFPSGFPSFGYVSIYGTFVDTTIQGYTDTPYVYVNYGIPANGLFNNGAVNGSFCWDTLNQVMYIQRGSLAATQWQYFDASQLIDYVTNPEVLHRAFLYGTGYYLYEGLTTGVIASNQVLSLQLYDMQEKKFYDKYEEYAKRAMSLLNMDISNGGTITSLDTKFQRANVWGAV